ncbi:MAG: type II secretion system protein GspC [Woeseia sp.]|nr:type II secretion system protein GspC [Woeseia sp.]|tara:strand:+ start:1241 stop:2173 length:933 start_codon:yes stop_codon:yes gene_type:complete
MSIEAKWSDFSNLYADKAITAVNRYLPIGVALSLVIAIAWKLATLMWAIMSSSETGNPEIVPPEQIVQSAADTRSLVDVQQIVNAHLFGVAEEISANTIIAIPEENYSNLAETRLNLMLKGTIASPVPENSVAIISHSRNEEKIYLIRDLVTQGTTVHAIYPDRVVLNRGGVLENLRLPREFPESAVTNRSRMTTTRTTSSNSVKSIQNVVAKNATKLADIIRPTPYYVSGEMRGYRVYPGRNRKQFTDLGLRPGDLIKDIDGAALTNPQQASQVFQNLGDKEQVSVTVERNGQREILVLQTNQLETNDE